MINVEDGAAQRSAATHADQNPVYIASDCYCIYIFINIGGGRAFLGTIFRCRLTTIRVRRTLATDEVVTFMIGSLGMEKTGRTMGRVMGLVQEPHFPEPCGDEDDSDRSELGPTDRVFVPENKKQQKTQSEPVSPERNEAGWSNSSGLAEIQELAPRATRTSRVI